MELIKHLKKQGLVLIVVTLLFLPVVLATVTNSPSYFSGLDFFQLFVINVFGNIAFAWFGLSVMMFVIGMLSRMSINLLIVIIICFTINYLWTSLGELVLVFVFIGVCLYTLYPLINLAFIQK